MPDYSMIGTALQLGGVVTASIDFETGEISTEDPRERRGRWWDLSTAHIRPEGEEEVKNAARVEIWGEGQLVKARRAGPFMMVGGGGGKRGEVFGFSRGSRRRLMQKLGTIQRKVKPVFCTLTYPDNYPAEAVAWKRDIKVFFQRLKRKYPAVGGVWRMEIKRRQSGEVNEGKLAPHFHILMWGEGAKNLMSFIPWAWFAIAGQGDNNHLLWHLGAMGGKNKPCCQDVESVNGVMSYASKYVCKVDLDQEIHAEIGNVGRIWGVFNAEVIPWADCETIYSTDREIKHLLRAMRRYMHLKGRSFCPALSLFSINPVRWGELVTGRSSMKGRL